MTTGYLRRPPGKEKPRHANAAGLGKGSFGRRAGSENTTFRHVVIAINRHGARLVVGRFDSFDDAKRNANILRKLARLTGGDVAIERVEGAR